VPSYLLSFHCASDPAIASSPSPCFLSFYFLSASFSVEFWLFVVPLVLVRVLAAPVSSRLSALVCKTVETYRARGPGDSSGLPDLAALKFCSSTMPTLAIESLAPAPPCSPPSTVTCAAGGKGPAKSPSPMWTYGGPLAAPNSLLKTQSSSFLAGASRMPTAWSRAASRAQRRPDISSWPW